MLYRETSRAAWEGFAPPTSAKLDDQIIAALTHVGRATCQEIEEQLGRSHQAVSGNLRHLVERGLVRPSGHFGRTRSNRRAIEWEIVPIADRVAQVEAAKDAPPEAKAPIVVHIEATDERAALEALAFTIGLVIRTAAKPLRLYNFLDAATSLLRGLKGRT